MLEVVFKLMFFLVPVLVIAAVLYFTVRKPLQEARELEARAKAGDREAQAKVDGMRKTREAMRRLAAGGEDPERQRLLAVGTRARAAIVDVRPMGLRVAPETRVPIRMVEVQLAVDLGGGASRTVTVVDTIAEPLLGRMLKGATVPVRVDPADPDRLVALWDNL